MTPADVARAALCEAGLPQVAAQVQGRDLPALPLFLSLHAKHGNVIGRAFVLAHQAAGHDVRMDAAGVGIDCTTCREKDAQVVHLAPRSPPPGRTPYDRSPDV